MYVRDLKNAKTKAAMPARPSASQTIQRKEEGVHEEEEMKVSNSISSSFLVLHLP